MYLQSSIIMKNPALIIFSFAFYGHHEEVFQALGTALQLSSLDELADEFSMSEGPGYDDHESYIV